MPGDREGTVQQPASRTRDRLLLAALALILAVFGWQGLTDAGGSLRAEQDHTITLSLSRQLETWHEYHPDFVYPLPAVVLKLALGSLGTGASSLLWMAILIASGVACAHALSVLLPPLADRSRYAASLLGAVAIVYCLQWDYRAVNMNSLFLALVLFSFVSLERGHAARAGALLAASIALKLYSAPLLLLFALRGQWRAVGWTLAAASGLFVVLPALWFGPTTALHLSALWVDQLAAAASPDAASRVTAYNVSLTRLVAAAFSAAGGIGASAPSLAARAIGLTFAAAVAARLWRGRAREDADETTAARPPRIRLTTDLGLVLAAILLLSPIAQPHHGVVLWPLAAVGAHLVLDGSRSRRGRAGIAVLLGSASLALIAAPSGIGKAAAQNGAIWLLAIAAVSGSRVGQHAPSLAPRGLDADGRRR